MSKYYSSATSTRAYDINMFYAEQYDSDTRETTLDDCLSMQIYLYVEDSHGSRNYEGECIRLTLAETRAIAPDFPESFWGSDWWIGVDSLLSQAKAVPERIQNWIDKLPHVDQFNAMEEPSWWIEKAS